MKEEYKTLTFGQEEENKTSKSFPADVTDQFFSPRHSNSEEEFWDNQSSLPGYQGVTVDNAEHTATKLLYNFLQIELNFTNKRVLDIGCGVGRLFPVFLGATATSITGVDLSSGMLKIAAFKFPQSNVKLLHLPADNLIALNDNSHDITIFSSTLCHLTAESQVVSAIKEAVRVTDNHGLIVLIEPTTINGFKEFEHSHIYLRSTTFLTDAFHDQDTHCIHRSRECFGPIENIDSYKTVIVYRKG